MQTLERVLRSNLTSYKDLASTTWAIRDWSRHPRLVRHNTQPTQSWRSCRSCTKSVEYIRRLDAGLHILENHYGQSSPLKAEVLLSFARNDRQFLVDARMDLVLGCLRTTNTVVQRLLSEAKDIQTWVARGPDAISGRYTLPNSLLRSLRYATMTLITIPRSMEEMDAWVTQLGKTAKPRHKKVKRLWYFGNRDWDDLWPYELAGMRSSDSMADAKREISSMAYLGSTRSSSTDAVGPEYMLSTVMSGLFHERFYKGLSIDKIYLSIYTKLVGHPTALSAAYSHSVFSTETA